MVSKADAQAEASLRVGVVGAGVMGSNHARVLAGLPDTTLVGVVDPLPAHRARATGNGRASHLCDPGGHWSRKAI